MLARVHLLVLACLETLIIDSSHQQSYKCAWQRQPCQIQVPSCSSFSREVVFGIPEVKSQAFKFSYFLLMSCQAFQRLEDQRVKHEFIGEYISHTMPPDHELAKKHREAQKVALPIQLVEGQQQEVCPCCLRPVNKPKISLAQDEMAFSFLGSGYPLYFNFIKCCLVIIGVLFMTSGQYSLISNLISEDCHDLVIQAQWQYDKHSNGWSEPVYNYCLNDFIALTTSANKRFETVLTSLPTYFNLTCVLFMLLIIFFFRKSQLAIDNECDIKENTPQDYSIIIKGLPPLQDPCSELKQFFQSNWDVEVCAVNPVYISDRLIPLQQQRQNLIEQKVKAVSSLEDNQATTLNAQISGLDEQIKNEAAAIQKDSTCFTGTAFVSFRFESHKQTVLKETEFSAKQIAFNLMMGCIFQETKQMKFNDTIIKADVAPEPGDIIWENMVHSDNKRFIYRVIGFTFSTLVITTFLIILLQLAKVQAIESSKTQGTLVNVETKEGSVEVMLPSQQTSLNVPSLLAALTTTFINSFVVGQLSLFLVRFESYETYSLYTVSLASKLSLMLFFNSAIVAFLASTFYTRNIYGPGGLIYTQMYFFISNAIIPPLVNLINPDRIVKLAKVWFIKKFKKIVTQQELNELYEYPPHAIELRYADIMKTLFITFFYAPLIPAGYLSSFLGLALYYFSEKITLSNYATVKITPSVQLSILMTEMMEYLPIIFAAGSMIFSYQIYGQFSYLLIVAMLVSLFSSILPMQYFVELLFPVEEQDEVTTFEEAQVNFTTFYDKENPVTKYTLPDEQEQIQPKTPRKSNL